MWFNDWRHNFIVVCSTLSKTVERATDKQQMRVKEITQIMFDSQKNLMYSIETDTHKTSMDVYSCWLNNLYKLSERRQKHFAIRIWYKLIFKTIKWINKQTYTPNKSEELWRALYYNDKMQILCKRKQSTKTKTVTRMLHTRM